MNRLENGSGGWRGSGSGTPLVRVAVVGHTNTGKTSLLRTLTRDTGFGEVSSRPSTTRHVEGARLSADGVPVLELYDTPGMEDASALFDWMEEVEAVQRAGAGERRDGPARVMHFLQSEVAGARFEQEAKVLRQLGASDAGLYVIDARDPVLGKHRDELEILAMCARPLLPVLNFVSDPRANETRWREALARLGLHAVIRFDTVTPERDGEALLYGKLATLLDAHRAAFNRLIESRTCEAQARHDAALRRVADLLLDVSACRLTVSEGDEQASEAARQRMNDFVRDCEQRCVRDLLALYRFSDSEVLDSGWPLVEGRWEDDLFNPETLRQAGLRVGSGAAAGAAAGLGVDMLFGGMTLGGAAALGALAGGGMQAVRQFGGRLRDRLSGRQSLSVDDAVLTLLALRALYLVEALEQRGHAATRPVERFMREGSEAFARVIADTLAPARAHPEWSSLEGAAEQDAGFERQAQSLTKALAMLHARLQLPEALQKEAGV